MAKIVIENRFALSPALWHKPAMKSFIPVAALLLAACVPYPGPTSSAPTAPAGDSCGPQAVVFVAAGDLFGDPPRRAGLATAEQLAADLARENAALERLQIAFDALLYCRWTEVRLIRADASAGAIPRGEASSRLAAAGGRLRQDVGRAGQIRTRVQARAARLEAALEAAAPGTTRGLGAARPGVTRAMASAPLVLRTRPEPGAPEAGRLLAGAEVTLRPGVGTFALVEASGTIGYAPGSAFTVLPALPVAATGDAGLRNLAATNIARREGFSQSLALVERNGLAGFEAGT